MIGELSASDHLSTRLETQWAAIYKDLQIKILSNLMRRFDTSFYSNKSHKNTDAWEMSVEFETEECNIYIIIQVKHEATSVSLARN